MVVQRFIHTNTSAALWRSVLAGFAAGVVGSWAKSQLEPPLQRVGERLFPPAPGKKLLRGADITGHPENMPPAVGANIAAEQLIHRKLTHDETIQVMTAIHYIFGTAAAVVYSVSAEQTTRVTVGAGVPAGAVLWGATHGSLVPLLGWQAMPMEMPTAWYVWELGSHLGYGFVVEGVRRMVRSVLA